MLFRSREMRQLDLAEQKFGARENFARKTLPDLVLRPLKGALRGQIEACAQREQIAPDLLRLSSLGGIHRFRSFVRESVLSRPFRSLKELKTIAVFISRGRTATDFTHSPFLTLPKNTEGELRGKC